MTAADFSLRVGTALFAGLIIGVERQWHHRMAGLRTYTLVAVGSALFVLIGALTPSDSSPTRIAGQIVTGIGFLGAGVIMRSGLNVRGLNTAGTIWCASAVGTMAGSGFMLQSLAGAIVVLSINTLLRPLVSLVNRQPMDPGEQEFSYALKLTCRGRQEPHIRSLLIQLTMGTPLLIHELESALEENDTRATIKARLSSAERQDMQVEQLIGRLSLEHCVIAVSWQLTPSAQHD